MSRRAAVLVAVALGALAACRDTSEFTTKSGHFGGQVVAGSFVRAGLPEDVVMCLTFDAGRLQDAPGSITTSDGRFRATPLRPIPQLWHDPLSTMSFGDGRVQNLLYVASPTEDGGGGDVMVLVSLMQSGGVEVRLLRGAPGADAAAPAGGPPLFGVFDLQRRDGPCPL